MNNEHFCFGRAFQVFDFGTSFVQQGGRALLRVPQTVVTRPPGCCLTRFAAFLSVRGEFVVVMPCG